MSLDLFIALVVFCLVGSMTPGPNNLMLMASGATFGLRRTIPHMLGVTLGHALMVALVGLGLMGLFDLLPGSRTILQIVSVIYLLWLAWKIATSVPAEPGARGGRPLTFLQAAAFQWVNPKAWTIALSAITIYAPDRDLTGVALVTLAFLLVNAPSVSTWAIAGQQVRRWLGTTRRLRIFNIAMAALLVGSLWPVLAG